MVDFCFRMLAFTGVNAYFRGAGGEPYRRQRQLSRRKRLWVSPVPLVPQDKEGLGSVISHEENVKFIFEESRTLHSNQLVNEAYLQKGSQSNNLLEMSRIKRASWQGNG
ncbi:hypothetical protein [Fictibacillus sp. FJAT-27399]|uniref:hypothetical protein n=1 Tax=Fictibacillus sp. FJAT-27399 TaxID=1729689 RepID=UPI0012E3999C|nr:hypothetical protein [Fictibacillus sp. FJAT-27399]